jgi:hypothetical protein
VKTAGKSLSWNWSKGGRQHGSDLRDIARDSIADDQGVEGLSK